MNDYKFIINKPVQVEETRHYEFKEIKGKKPLDSIKNTCDEYVVAFLNSDGGHIFWGIRDSDRFVVGVELTLQERDDLRKNVTAKLNQIQPPISPSAYQINLHPIFENEDGQNLIENNYVVEIVAPRVFSNDLYSTEAARFLSKRIAEKETLFSGNAGRNSETIYKDKSADAQKEVLTETQPEFVFEFLFKEGGLVVNDESEFEADVAEILYAADTKHKLLFKLDYEPLKILANTIKALEKEEPSAENRLYKVSILNLIKDCEKKLLILQQALPLLFQKPVRDLFLYPIELAASFQNMSLMVLGKNVWSYSKNRRGIDVFRKKEPAIGAVIWVDEEETKQIEETTKISIFDLMGNFGFDLFDLPRPTLVEKAIPAMLLEINRIERKHNTSLNLKQVLNLNEWYIGLH